MRFHPGFRLLRRHQVPEGGDFARGGEAQTLQRAAAGPVDELVMADLRRMDMIRQHALDQIVDLLEVRAAGDGEFAGAPEVFERRLVRMPVPPAAGDMILRLDLAGHDGAVLQYALVGLLEGGLEPLTAPLAPALDQRQFLTAEPVFPIDEEGARQDRGIVRPVFEQRAVLFEQLGQMFAPIGLVARKQDLMMRPLDGADAVDLYEADVVDQLQQPRLGQGAVRRI